MFKNPFSFQGRIRRLEYGLSYLIYFAVMLVLSVAAEVEPGGAFALVMLVLFIPLFWFMLAQGAKRCHDRNNSGFFQIIPFYGLWMLFAAGDSGDNDFGPNPKEHLDGYAAND